MSHRRASVPAGWLLLAIVFFVPSIACGQATPQSGGGGVVPNALPVPFEVQVTPDNAAGPTRSPNTGPYSITFTVKNTGQNADTYAMECNHLGAVSACGPVSPASVTLASGAQRTVTTSYSVGAVGTGTVAVVAEGQDIDGGSYTITVSATAETKPGVALRNFNGDNLDRSLCLTSGAGEAAAYQCGDLFIVHSMPGYTTMNKERSLSLIYNSAQAFAMPRVAVAATQPANFAQPTKVYAELRVNGTLRDSSSYSKWGGGATPQVRQLVLRYDVTVGSPMDSTGVYPFTVLVRNVYDISVKDSVLSGRLIVVNRSQSEYGTGWSVAGVERLYLNQPVGAPDGSILWVGGDGSAKVYSPVSGQANTWLAARGGFQDTLRLSGTEYTRTLRHGVQVTFDAQGRHIKTKNRTGQFTTFAYTSGLLTGITVPPASQGLTYILAYDAAGKLDRITDPALRVLNATVSGGLLTNLTDPDLKTTTFAYTSPYSPLLVSARTNRRGLRTDFLFGQSRLSQVSVPVDSPTTKWAVTTFEPWDLKGATFTPPHSSLASSVDTAQVFSVVRGPRPNIADDATFWVDRWGAPVKIVDPLGNTTTLVRADTNFPALVTRITVPNGKITDQSYDGRGNLKKVRDNVWPAAGDPPTHVTEYQYPTSGTFRDSPILVQDSIGSKSRKTRYVYNPTLGLPDTVIDPMRHRTSFGYKTDATYGGLLTRVTEHNVETWQETAGAADNSFAWKDLTRRFDYDAKGDLRADTSTVKVATSYARDTKGRVTSVYDPLGTQTERSYDEMNRVTQTQAYSTAKPHPLIPQPLSGCDVTQVVCADNTKAWDALPAAVPTAYTYGATALQSVSDPRGVTRNYGYDARDLVVRETDDYNQQRRAFYSMAGAIDSSLSRTGKTVRFYYDAAGRRTAMAFSQVASPVPGSPNVVPGDSVQYTYDAMGNLLTAGNREGTITRSYYTNGLLKRKIMSFVVGFADTIAYAYDATGAVTQVTHGQDVTTYAYTDTTGVLQTMSVSLGPPASITGTFSFLWDSLGRRKKVTYPVHAGASMTVEFRYDAAGTLRRLISNHPGGASPDLFDFTFRNVAVDPIGRAIRDSLTCATVATHGSPCGTSNRITTANDYNRLSALLRQTKKVGSTPYVDSMSYDVSGNLMHQRKDQLGEVHTFVLDAGIHNRLQSFTRAELSNSSRVITHDSDGSRVHEIRAPWEPTLPEERYYYYDGLGRNSGTGEWLVVQSSNQFSDRATACLYDADGQMVSPCENGAAKLSFDGNNTSGTLFAGPGTAVYGWHFFHGPALDDPLMGYFRPSSGIPRLFYWVTDGEGRQFTVADTLGSRDSNDELNETGGYRYAGGTNSANTFDADRFSSSTAPKLSFFRNRSYDQESGRWTQEDPIGVAGGLNLYQFNQNNPVMYTDPFGLRTCPPDCGAIHAVGAMGGAIIGGIVGAAGGAAAGTAVAPVAGTFGGGMVGGAEGAALGAAGGLAAANAAEAAVDVGAQAMGGVSDWLKRVLVAGGIYVGGGVPDRAKGSDNPPEVEQPAKPPKPDENKPDEDEQTE